jgi:lantibiotic transport system permease protein
MSARVPFRRSVRSEWLKGRRSLASWLVVGGALLVPAILLAVRLRQRRTLGALYRGEVFWEELWNQAWESLAVLLLPMGVIVLTSLVTHLEHRYNGWKQVRATPQSDVAIFAAKLVVVLAMLAQWFVLLNVGLWLVGVVPPLLFEELPMPAEPFPLAAFAARSLDFYVDALPVVGLQFLVALRSRNVLVPVGVGLGAWTVAMTALAWRYNFLLPHGYVAMDFLSETGGRVSRELPAPLGAVALAAFGATTLLAYAHFAAARDRG